MATTNNNTIGMKSVADITRQYGLIAVKLFNTEKDSNVYEKRLKKVYNIALRYLTNLQNNGYINPYVNIRDYLDGNTGEKVGSFVKLPKATRLESYLN